MKSPNKGGQGPSLLTNIAKKPFKGSGKTFSYFQERHFPQDTLLRHCQADCLQA